MIQRKVQFQSGQDTELSALSRLKILRDLEYYSTIIPTAGSTQGLAGFSAVACMFREELPKGFARTFALHSSFQKWVILQWRLFVRNPIELLSKLL